MRQEGMNYTRCIECKRTCIINAIFFPHSLQRRGIRFLERQERGDQLQPDQVPNRQLEAVHHIHVQGGGQERPGLFHAQQGELPDHDPQGK